MGVAYVIFMASAAHEVFKGVNHLAPYSWGSVTWLAAFEALVVWEYVLAPEVHRLTFQSSWLCSQIVFTFKASVGYRTVKDLIVVGG